MSEEIEVSDDGGCPNMGLETVCAHCPHHFSAYISKSTIYFLAFQCFLDYHKSKCEKGKKAAIIM